MPVGVYRLSEYSTGDRISKTGKSLQGVTSVYIKCGSTSNIEHF